jgi:endonuclease YncB( thermonuclease family)
MNTRAKFTVVALLSVFALASNPAKADVLGFSVALPNFGAVTAEVGKIVASDLTASLRNALSQPRATRTRQSPTVTIVQVVEGATMETVTVVATRLPPQATETLAQANTHTRL